MRCSCLPLLPTRRIALPALVVAFVAALVGLQRARLARRLHGRRSRRGAGVRLLSPGLLLLLLLLRIALRLLLPALLLLIRLSVYLLLALLLLGVSLCLLLRLRLLLHLLRALLILPFLIRLSGQLLLALQLLSLLGLLSLPVLVGLTCYRLLARHGRLLRGYPRHFSGRPLWLRRRANWRTGVGLPRFRSRIGQGRWRCALSSPVVGLLMLHRGWQALLPLRRLAHAVLLGLAALAALAFVRFGPGRGQG